MLRRSIPLTAVMIGFTLAGCGAEAGPDARIVFRDSAGIRIVENPSPDDSAANEWWRIGSAITDIGGIDAEEPYALFRVTDAVRLSDGRIAVGSSASDDIRYFDQAGQHLGTSGRTGGGPGEYQNVNGLERADGDSILVVDPSARRVSVLDEAGEYVREFDVGDNVLVTRVVGRFDDGSLLTAPAIVAGPEPGSSSAELLRPPFVLVRVATGTGAPDTLGEFPGAERFMRVTASNGQLTSINISSIPFGKSPTFAVHASEIYVGSQDDPEIQVYDADGVLRRIIRTGRQPEPVTEAHLAAQFEANIEAMPEEMRAQARAAGRQELPHGEVVPPYGELVVDHVGRLWASDYDDPTDPPGRWTVYSPDGGVVSRIVLPPRFRPFDIGEDWILGRELDEFDVEHIMIYPLLKGTQ